MKHFNRLIPIYAGLLLISNHVGAACMNPTVFSETGADNAGIVNTVNNFNDTLGQLNPFEPGSVGSGRRSINWDAAPDAVSAPSAFPGDFFNAGFSPRARGIEFTSPGNEFQLSATEASGTGVEFNNLNPDYADQFTVFSAERLFSPINSNIVTGRFFIPGEDTPAISSGFGAVFTDVDVDGSTSIEFFDELGNSFAVMDVPANPSGLTFYGVTYDAPCISRVRIIAGNSELGPDEVGDIDVVAMDDFIYGEPVANPDAPEFNLNVGLAGAWFNPATPGQGFMVDLLTDARQFLFIAWFTHTPEGELQWFTAGGDIVGNGASLDLMETTGGIFNTPSSVVNTIVGEITATFTDCLNGTIDFDITDQALTGSIPITRIAGDQICQAIADGDLVIPNEITE